MVWTLYYFGLYSLKTGLTFIKLPKYYEENFVIFSLKKIGFLIFYLYFLHKICIERLNMNMYKSLWIFESTKIPKGICPCLLRSRKEETNLVYLFGPLSDAHVLVVRMIENGSPCRQQQICHDGHRTWSQNWQIKSTSPN